MTPNQKEDLMMATVVIAIFILYPAIGVITMGLVTTYGYDPVSNMIAGVFWPLYWLFQLGVWIGG